MPWCHAVVNFEVKTTCFEVVLQNEVLDHLQQVVFLPC